MYRHHLLQWVEYFMYCVFGNIVNVKSMMSEIVVRQNDFAFGT
jgi:hypothetical protein